MTYKEKLMLYNPKNVDEKYIGGCCGCPSNYNFFPFDKFRCKKMLEDCTICWTREIPNHDCKFCGGTLSDVRTDKDNKKYRHCYSCHFEFYIE